MRAEHPTPKATAPAEFDLATQREELAKTNSGSFWLNFCGGIFATSLGIVGIVILLDLPPSSRTKVDVYGLGYSDSLTILFAIMLLLVVGGVFIANLSRGHLPGARSVRVSGEGVTFVYEAGRCTEFRWKDSGWRLMLEDYSGVAMGTMGYLAHGVRDSDRRSSISKEAYEAILASAAQNGAVITPSKSVWYSMWGQQSVLITGSAAKSPSSDGMPA